MHLSSTRVSSTGRGRPSVQMSEHAQALPIDAALPGLTGALRAHNAAVLVAPPGAGTTTPVPLALAREVQLGLREDLKLLVMSATLDGARVGRLLDNAPAIESAGRAFPVETRYLGRDTQQPVERQVADAIVRALRTDAGSLLVFL